MALDPLVLMRSCPDQLQPTWRPIPGMKVPVSVKIRERLVAARKRFNANDSIAEFIQRKSWRPCWTRSRSKMRGVLDSGHQHRERPQHPEHRAPRGQDVPVGCSGAASPVTGHRVPNAEHLNELMIVGPDHHCAAPAATISAR